MLALRDGFKFNFEILLTVMISSFRSVNSPFSSQHNLTRESQSHVSLSHVPKSPQYSEDEGVLRVFIRNKAINLQCPSHLRDSYNLDCPTAAPRQRLKLEWVYGYRGRDARCNLMLLPTGRTTLSSASLHCHD